MATYAYGRVSTGHQMMSLTEQQRQITRFAEHRFAQSIDAVYCDEGVSAWKKTFGNRPQGGQLFARLWRGDTLIIAKLDRGFRDTADALDTVRRFRDLGI